MLAQVIVLVIVVALVGGGAWAFTKSRSIGRDADAALAELGQVLDAPFDMKSRSFNGHLAGRRVTVSEERQGSEGEYDYFVRIIVATRTPDTVEIVRQASGLKVVQGLETGDPDFDRWFVVQSSNPPRVLQALTPDVRRQWLDWQTSGWLWEVRVRNGELRYAGGEGLFRRKQIERTRTILADLVAFAARLE